MNIINRQNKTVLIAAFVLAGSIITNNALADDLIPSSQSGLYYKLGGGNDVPLPASYTTTSIPLNVLGNIGTNFDCGTFNPLSSITNSLNQIKSSFLAVKTQVLASATAAVTAFPMYELSRADPNLYNIITNALTDAQENLDISTKSCEVMQSEIAAGQDPYAHWGQISLGNQWQMQIGDASASGNGDINQASQAVSADGGKSGVPWVNPNAPLTQGQANAGGIGQPVIHVINDSAMAGYQVIANSPPSPGPSPSGPSELQTVFPTSQDAASWITNVVGDQSITTYDGGPKTSQAGGGLYADIQTETQRIQPLLQALISGSTAVTVQNLQAISTEGMTLSPDMVQSIQSEPAVIQSIIVNILAENLAAMTVIDKARLGIQVLQSGAKIPAVYANEAAQHNINDSVAQLQQDVQQILMFVKARDMLMSNMLSTLVASGNDEIKSNTMVAVPELNSPLMQEGAVATTTPASAQQAE